MIFLTRLDGKRILLNEALFEMINQTPDTIISLSNGHSYVVQEGMDEIQQRIIAFNRASKRRLTGRRQENADEQS